MAWRELGPDETSDLRQDLGRLVNRWIRRLTGRVDAQPPPGPAAEDDAAVRAVQALLAAEAPQLDRLDQRGHSSSNGTRLTDTTPTDTRPADTKPADSETDDVALFPPVNGELTPAERAVTHLARLNTLRSLQAAVQDRIDKLVHDAGQAGAGYPDIAKALRMTRQNARKRWPEAVHHGPGRRPKREQPDI